MWGRVLKKDGNCRYKVLKCTRNNKMVSAAGVRLESGAIVAEVREKERERERGRSMKLQCLADNVYFGFSSEMRRH